MARSAKPGREKPADRLLLRLSDGLARTGDEQRLVADNSERNAVQAQFARFAGVCRTFAPIYRQMTIGAVAAAAAGADVTRPAMFAYADVANAWRTYLARYNKGRPFVLIGHSQGSLMLQELIKHEIEGKPIAKQMRLAILPGYNVLVPQGKRVGGTFKSTPICASPGETGCVMSWVSFRENNAPPAGAIFGIAPPPGMTVACTNPARPGSTRWEAARQLLERALLAACPRRADQLVDRRRAADPVPSHRGSGLGPLRQRRTARLSVDTHQRRPKGQAYRPGLRRGRHPRHVHPRLGHAPRRRRRAQGDLIRRVGDISARSRTGSQPAR